MELRLEQEEVLELLVEVIQEAVLVIILELELGLWVDFERFIEESKVLVNKFDFCPEEAQV
jgi:hypothetical protein